MNPEPIEPNIEEILADLRSDNIYRRKKAATSIREHQVKDERIIEALKDIAAREPDRSTRKEASTTLTAMGIETPPLDPVLVRKNKEFWQGVGLFFGLNILLFVVISVLQIAISNSSLNSSSGAAAILVLILGFSPFVINIGLMIYFAVTNHGQIATGMLAGFGIALAIVICLGVIFMVACFVSLGSSNGGL
jgi:hypothetical protein